MEQIEKVCLVYGVHFRGGNTAMMLDVWKSHGIDTILREAYDKGITLGGSSAGGLCWYESGITDAFGPDLQPIRNTLGFLKGSFSPHYTEEDAARRSTFKRLIAAGEIASGIGAGNGVMLQYVDGELNKVVIPSPINHSIIYSIAV